MCHVSLVTMLASLPPQDVLFPLVLARLAPSDLFHVRGCSSELHSLVTDFFSYNRSLDLSYNKRLTKEAFKIITTSHHIRNLSLAGLKFLTDDLLRPLLQRNPHIVSLDISDCQHLTAGILQTLSVLSYQLERLVLRDCHWVTREALEYHAHHQGRSVTRPDLAQLSSPGLRVDTAKSPQPSKPTPKSNLREVELTGCWELNDQVLVNFVSNFPELRVVKLGKIYSVTDTFMKGLAKHSRHLQTLDITGCWRVSDQGKANI